LAVWLRLDPQRKLKSLPPDPLAVAEVRGRNKRRDEKGGRKGEEEEKRAAHQ